MTKLCLIAGNYLEAERWASSQMLDNEDWFYPAEIEELYRKCNFHVVVIGTAGQNVPASYFEKLLSVAQHRGRIGR